MSKLVKESLNEDSQWFYKHRPFGNSAGQAEVDRENARLAYRLDQERFWIDVANAMGGELKSFSADDENRNIVIEIGNKPIEINHSWRSDGSPIKPVTKVNDENIGRFSIWDDPGEYAEDIEEIMAEQGKYDDEEDEY